MYIEITYPRFKALTAAGLPAVGYKVYTYDAGGSTPATTWSDRTLSTENSFPIVLDAAGECLIFTNQQLKLILKTSADVVVWTMDYLGEQQQTIINSAEATPGTTNNNYAAVTSPLYTSIPDSLTLIFTPDVDCIGTVPTTVHTGAGKNDCVITGPYLGTTSGSVFEVLLFANGTPDTIKWRKDGGAYTGPVAITAGIKQNMIEGMSFRFSEATGHTVNNKWTSTVVTPARLTFCGLGPYTIYKNMDGALVGLEEKDMLAGIPATLVWSVDNTCWILNNPSSNTSSSTSTTGTRERKQETGDYTLLTDDKGNLIDFVNTVDVVLTLDPAANYNGMFYYIRAGGTANVTITANGTEKILSEQTPDPGASTYVLNGRYGKTVQLQCNGVSWEVLLEPPVNVTYKLVTKAMSPYSYTPTPGRKWLVAIPQGGGGSGSSNIGSGYGGAAGGKAIKAISTVGLTVPVTVTIGAGGASANGGADGSTGGTTSFGTACSATGGSGGTTGPGTPGTGVDGHINKSGNDGILTGAGGNPVDPFGDANYGGGGACANPSGAGEDGACWVFELPDYMGPLIPMIFQGINVWTTVNT